MFVNACSYQVWFPRKRKGLSPKGAGREKEFRAMLA